MIWQPIIAEKNLNCCWIIRSVFQGSGVYCNFPNINIKIMAKWYMTSKIKYNRKKFSQLISSVLDDNKFIWILEHHTPWSELAAWNDPVMTVTLHRSQVHLHWGQPCEATVVKMAPTRPLASRSFCLLTPLSDHRSLSNLQQSNTRTCCILHQNDRLVPFLVFVQ